MASYVQHVSAFSPDGKLFALINENGILKIWDTETNALKQEYTPNLHLSSPCTCLIWVTLSSKRKDIKLKKYRKSLNNDENAQQLYLALGTSNGLVTMYSYGTGEVDRTFIGEGHSCKINSIAYDNFNLLYTCANDCEVIVWNISEEKRIASWNIGNEKPHSMIYLPISEKILLCARQLKLFSPETQEIVQVYIGHTSEITNLSYFEYNNVEYALSASKMERIICLWTINKKNKNKSASCTFIMEDIAQFVDSKVDKDGNFKVAAVTRSGVIHIYLNNISNIKAEKPIKPKITLSIADDTSTIIIPIPAIAVSFKFAAGGKEILFGYGDKNVLQFEHISPEYTKKLEVLNRQAPKKLMQKKSQKQKENSFKTVTPLVKSEDVEYANPSVVSRKKSQAIQLPMETRLQNLNLENKEFPQAESKVQLLIQALQSSDANILQTIFLSVKDPKVIHLTIQKLPIQYISSLVNELTLLMQKKRSSVQIASNWLTILVKVHSSQLMASGTNELFTKFGSCLGIIEHRTNCLKELSKLNGRLQLLTNQIRQNVEETIVNEENVLVYEDKDSSNSDVDDIDLLKTSSEEEWAENESEDDMDVS